MSASDLRVIFFDHQKVSVDLERLAAVAERTAGVQGAVGEISIELVDSGRIAELNRLHMGCEGPTDVLSFPVDGLVTVAGKGGPPVVVGEVVLCPEVAAAETDFPAHLDLLIAHGVLHLLGYDHDTEAAAHAMRAAEKAATGRCGASAS